MDISWPLVKDVFFTIGSLAGVFAFFRPVFEKRHQRDIARAKRVIKLLPEQQVVDLESFLYQFRNVPGWLFQPFDQLSHELRANQDSVRFSGPIRKALHKELLAMLSSYAALRKLVQVPYWEPRAESDNETSWLFNKEAFNDENGIPREYAEHLDKCADYASEIKRAYQRFQIAADTHFLEAPVARWLLRRRYRAHGVA